MQTKYIGGKNAVETCRLNTQKNVTDRTSRKKLVHRICRQITQREKIKKHAVRTNRQNVQTEQVDKLCRQNMHRPSPTFATFILNRHKCIFSVILKNIF
jgi:hypothetical protein